jgi:hypothetical protein
MLTIAILSLVGLGYLSKFSFSSTDVGTVRSIDMTDTEKNLCRMTVVLLWIQLALAIVVGIKAAVNK